MYPEKGFCVRQNIANFFLTSCKFVCQFFFDTRNLNHFFVGSMEVPAKAFLLFFLLPDWLKLNHLKSRIECGFSDIFSCHFCSIVAETIGLTNYTASFGAKKCSENHI